MAEPIPLELPPGFYGNGNPYSAAGRFATGNLVRFLNGYVRPIGGWRRRKDQEGNEVPPIYADPSVETARNGIQWQDNDGGAHVVIGTNRGLYEISTTGLVTDITPADFVPAETDASEAVGYGTARYGREAYGTRRSGLGFQLEHVPSWSFSLFGEILLAQFRGDGPLYKWQPGLDISAVAITDAPLNAQAVLVTSERIVMLIFEEPRKVQWSDRETYDVWIPTVSNTAGDQTLAGKGKLVDLQQVGREILINSTADAWVGRFLGAPFIYGFEEAGQGCGSSAPNSCVIAGGRAYWFGRGGFWSYDGSVRKLESDVDDWVRENIDARQSSKVYGFELPSTRECWWFFQSADGDDCDRYLIYNYVEEHWAYGALERSVGIPPVPSNTPIFIGLDGIIYDHDMVGTDIPEGFQDFAETGPLEFGGGGQIMGVQFIYPDLVPDTLQGGVTSSTIQIIGKDWPDPEEPERLYGPYSINRKPIATTGVRGREIRLRYLGDGVRWRGGKQRLVVVPLGER